MQIKAISPLESLSRMFFWEMRGPSARTRKAKEEQKIIIEYLNDWECVINPLKQ